MPQNRSINMHRFAANLSLLYPELPFLARFGAAADDGFQAVEYQFAYEFEPQDIAAQLRMHGLALVLLNAPAAGCDAAGWATAWSQSERGTAALPGREQEFRSGLREALRHAQALACPCIHVMAGCIPVSAAPGASREEWVQHMQAVYLDNLRWAAALADPLGITLLIEPLNQRDAPRYFLNRQDHAHEIVRAVGAPNLKVQMDLYHCQIVEGDLATKLRQYLPTGRVGHLQVAGVPERHEPDVGEINYAYLFKLINELGYDGVIGCEYRPARGAVVGGTSAGLNWLRNLPS